MAKAGKFVVAGEPTLITLVGPVEEPQFMFGDNLIVNAVIGKRGKFLKVILLKQCFFQEQIRTDEQGIASESGATAIGRVPTGNGGWV